MDGGAGRLLEGVRAESVNPEYLLGASVRARSCFKIRRLGESGTEVKHGAF